MTNRNLIIGAGGHGKVIADIMLCQGMEVLGFLDDNSQLIGQCLLSLPVLAEVGQWADFYPDGLVVGIGDNAIRRAVVELLETDAAPSWITVLHPNATVAHSSHIGAGTVVMANAVINPDVQVGRHAIINTSATVDHIV